MRRDGRSPRPAPWPPASRTAVSAGASSGSRRFVDRRRGDRERQAQPLEQRLAIAARAEASTSARVLRGEVVVFTVFFDTQGKPAIMQRLSLPVAAGPCSADQRLVAGRGVCRTKGQSRWRLGRLTSARTAASMRSNWPPPKSATGGRDRRRAACPAPPISWRQGADAAPIAWRISGGHDDAGRPSLTVRLDGVVPLVCQRCLQPFGAAVAQQTDLLLARNEAELARLDAEDAEVVLRDTTLDPRNLVEDELLLSLPVVAAP